MTAIYSTTFTETRTNRAAAPKRLTDRTDLGSMKVQRHTAYVASRTRLQIVLVKDYEKTVSTRHTHHKFLQMMLNEVQQFHRRVHGAAIPTKAMALMAVFNAQQMGEEEEDQYAECLRAMCCKRLYFKEFIDFAVDMVREQQVLIQQKLKQDELLVVSESQGVKSQDCLSTTSTFSGFSDECLSLNSSIEDVMNSK